MIRFVLSDWQGHYFRGDYLGKFEQIVHGTSPDLQDAVVFTTEISGQALAVQPPLPEGDNWTARAIKLEMLRYEQQETQQVQG